MGILKFLIGLQVLLFAAAVFGILYLVFRRIKKSKQETFEKRDN